MEVSATRTRRFTGPVPKSRAITGPTPHSVSILDRPKLTRPPDWLTLERIKKEDHRDGYVKVVDYNDKNSLKNLFLEKTDHKIQINTIKKRVSSMLLHEKYSLDERRDRLRDLFSSEEQVYLTEMADKEETVLERQARMRERARSLREKREVERVAEAEAKLEQRWRNQCEELRGVKIKNHLQEVTKDRGEQLRLKEEEAKRKQKEEDMYAQLWKEDWAVKCQREDMETVLQIERNKEMLDLLNTQTAARECEKEDLRILKAKEAEILREEVALRAMEERKQQEDKRRRQKMTKKSLDYSLKLKMKHRAKEVQEELAFDMKLLEQMLTESSNEAKDNLERKKQLKEEVRIYREYLHELAEEELRREKELDAIVTGEVEKQWERRAAQWQREADARKQLLHDVMATRKQQVQKKLSLIEQEKAQIVKDRAEVLKNLDEHLQLERQQQEGRFKVNKTHQKHLIQQMEYLTSAEKAEKQQIKDDWALCLEAEATYKKKVQDAIKDMAPTKLHPTRLMLSGKLV